MTASPYPSLSRNSSSHSSAVLPRSIGLGLGVTGIAIALLCLSQSLFPAHGVSHLVIAPVTRVVDMLTDLFPSELFTAAGLSAAVAQAGLWGPALYVLLLVVSVVVSQIPGAGLAIAAGAIWGPGAAGVYTIVGGFLGALIAYGLGRLVGPKLLKRLTGKSIVFSRERGDRYLGGLIFLMRLLPVFSFDLISYGAGMTGLSFPIYASATLLGMIPSTFLLTYMGGAFHLGMGGTITLLGLCVAGLVLLPWGVRRYNWFDLQGVVQIQ